MCGRVEKERGFPSVFVFVNFGHPLCANRSPEDQVARFTQGKLHWGRQSETELGERGGKGRSRQV